MKTVALYYLKIYPAIVQAAAKWHYAIAIHGSMERDFDLIAVPWLENAGPVEKLVEEIRVAVDGHITPTGTKGGRWDPVQGKFVEAIIENPVAKPHGRLAFSIHLAEYGSTYIDLSVMPKLDK